ncbi:TetR/AcrR family transcriptional regulator [Mycobacteroides chelonae]|uniref:TetR/AcrR family transcriptional regulator n=1 Tax=Mycobacteroides chelonae TaxID=1774 RepID=UPI0008A987E0|nr:TetR/AcrR family transcriptional regulator [Mycobacteroides chelonae]OHU63629.1 TetR family transcriptional regulator [Mycobacteroides chelonae]
MPTSQKTTDVPATRRSRLRAQTMDEIKSLARQQLAAEGTGGVSLRGIARQMGMAPAALFRYFDTQSALITVLISETYETLAETMLGAKQRAPKNSAAQMRAICTAFRQWALLNPSDFALIAGTPLPGYHAQPSETGPAAARVVLVFGLTYHEAIKSGAADPSATAFRPVSPGPLLRHLVNETAAVDPIVIGVVISAWSSIAGFLASEVFGSLGQLVGDADSLFRDHLATVIDGMGFKPAEPKRKTASKRRA